MAAGAPPLGTDDSEPSEAKRFFHLERQRVRNAEETLPHPRSSVGTDLWSIRDDF